MFLFSLGVLRALMTERKFYKDETHKYVMDDKSFRARKKSRAEGYPSRKRELIERCLSLYDKANEGGILGIYYRIREIALENSPEFRRYWAH